MTEKHRTGDEAVRSRRVSVLGAQIAVLEAGEPSRPAVLFLHGARFRARTWLELGTLARVAQANFHAIAVDLPGYGDSPAFEHEPAALLAALFEALGVQRPVLVSPSMSGRYSLASLEQAPDAIRALVAVAPIAIAEHAGLSLPDLPALLVWGDGDTLVPLSAADSLARCLPQARRRVLAGAGHACYMDQPEAFHEALLEFLALLP